MDMFQLTTFFNNNLKVATVSLDNVIKHNQKALTQGRTDH